VGVYSHFPILDSGNGAQSPYHLPPFRCSPHSSLHARVDTSLSADQTARLGIPSMTPIDAAQSTFRRLHDSPRTEEAYLFWIRALG
jgi:hypothetical protein